MIVGFLAHEFGVRWGMGDFLTPQRRSAMMARIRAKDTKPELTVRQYLFRCGFRFRIHDKRLPGTPDIVLPKYRTVIFVHGCFWHGHHGCTHFRLPSSHVDFWRAKILRNRERDQEHLDRLESLSWRVIVVWECELRNKSIREATLHGLVNEIWEVPRDANRNRGD
ncbi:MAG: DNA mismatch endonuclease Vsr [Sphaerochaetaceae bacterium]|nr:DNA mismatch endonuclease Vsr [Sphaerochaetaceae bacterium]